MCGITVNKLNVQGIIGFDSHILKILDYFLIPYHSFWALYYTVRGDVKIHCSLPLLAASASGGCGVAAICRQLR